MQKSGTGEESRTERKAVVTALVRSPEVEASLYKALFDNAGIELRARHVEDIDMAACQAMRGDVLVLDIDPSSHQELALLTEFVTERSGTPIVVTSPWLEVNSMCQLMRIGVRHIVPQPVDHDQIAHAIEQALARRGEPAEPASAPKGLVVSVMGSCGGVGASSLAVQSACALARRTDGPATCLLDLDIQFGTTALLLDLEPRGSVIDLIQQSERLDGAMLRGAMARAARGSFDVLAAPTTFHPMDEVEPDRIAAVVETASSEYALTLLDVPLLWSNWTHAALRCSNLIVLVVQPTVPALRLGRRQLEMLRQEELDDIPLTVVLNRAESSVLGANSVTLKEAATALGRKVDHVIPESPALKAAAQSGLPLGEVRGGPPLEKKIAAIFGDILQARQPLAASVPLPRAFRLPFWRGGFSPALAATR
jgi:pilus assembly protein CpaE